MKGRSLPMTQWKNTYCLRPHHCTHLCVLHDRLPSLPGHMPLGLTDHYDIRCPELRMRM